MADTASRSLRSKLVVLVLSCALGCGGRGEEPAPEATQAREDSASETTATARVAVAQERAYVHSSERCGECHASAFEEWTGSPHANAAISPLYLAMRDRRPESAPTCQPCHSPVAAWVEPNDPLVREGVACDGCHAVRDVALQQNDARLDLRLDDNTKYAALCDAEDHYFHRMGCSELHGTAQICAGCHHLVRETAGAALPIYSEYLEWSGGPHGEEGMHCQFCHMPQRTGEVAVGSPPRDSLSHHGFFGESGDLRARALALAVSGAGQGDEVELHIRLENDGAGHFVPSGMPGRRIIVRARALSRTGEELGRAEHQLGRVLVDAAGREVPHHEAVRMASDDRIGPRQSKQIPLRLVAAEQGQIVVEVIWRELSDDLATALGQDAPREQLLSRATLSMGPPAPRRRFGRARIEAQTEGGNL